MHNGLLLTDDLLLAPGKTNTELLAIRLSDGSTAWTATLPDTGSLESRLAKGRVHDGRLFLPGSNQVSVIDLATGQAQETGPSCEDLEVAANVMICSVSPEGQADDASTIGYPLLD